MISGHAYLEIWHRVLSDWVWSILASRVILTRTQHLWEPVQRDQLQGAYALMYQLRVLMFTWSSMRYIAFPCLQTELVRWALECVGELEYCGDHFGGNFSNISGARNFWWYQKSVFFSILSIPPIEVRCQPCPAHLWLGCNPIRNDGDYWLTLGITGALILVPSLVMDSGV